MDHTQKLPRSDLILHFGCDEQKQFAFVLYLKQYLRLQYECELNEIKEESNICLLCRVFEIKVNGESSFAMP